MSKAWLGVLWMSAVLAAPGGGGGSQAEAQPLQQQAAESGTPSTPTIGEKTAGMEKLGGHFNLYWDAKQGKIWLEIDKWGTEFLYQSGLPAGIGSNDIGLDRGQLGATRIVRFDRSGPKVLLVQENLEYRALSQDPDERRAVRDSFAESALWGFTAAAEEKDRALVDATDFFLRDAHHVPEALRRTKQGAYRLDLSRSAIYLPRTKNFPLNTEVEATLTFTGEEPGPWVRQVTPSPEAITVREHHSFVQLPPPGYKPREYDARASFFGIQYLDYPTPIGEPLLAPYAKGKPVSPKIEQMALARLRQLAAHEVGHTLGLEHNYSASTVNRSSVMDYPPPYVKLDAGGVPDLSDAYAMGIGEWDKVSIAYGYQDFPPGVDEHAALDKILKDAFARGLRFLTDQDARPAGSSSSLAHLWDSGTNAVDELRRLLEVRVAALKRFGENNIREGAPMATLEDVLVPLYLMHRYQVEAASKVVGGMDYTFALRGDGETPTQIVAPAEQRRALAVVLATLRPDVLALPESLLEMIPPRPPEYERGREHFKIRTSPVFDGLAPAEAAAEHTLGFLFNA